VDAPPDLCLSSHLSATETNRNTELVLQLVFPLKLLEVEEVLDRVIPHIIDSNICYCVIACLEVDCVSIDTSLFRISHCLL
jgi:hypothetical protein